RATDFLSTLQRLFQGGNLRKCCGNRTYDPRRLACCRGDELKPLGTCT
ncbi:unnamed protein product, partial [Oikopleura dioica]